MQLDKTTRTLLKTIKENPEIELKSLKAKFGDTIGNSIEYLLEERLIYQPVKSVGGGSFAPADCYSISAKGKTYYRYRFRNTLFKIAPFIISFISLLFSAYSIYVSSCNCP